MVQAHETKTSTSYVVHLCALNHPYHHHIRLIVTLGFVEGGKVGPKERENEGNIKGWWMKGGSSKELAGVVVCEGGRRESGVSFFFFFKKVNKLFYKSNKSRVNNSILSKHIPKLELFP